MPYDVAFRHEQALDPSSLTTIGTTLHAITRAIDDCRNAGHDAERDPAVILLARHLARVTECHSEDGLLKRRCMTAAAELKRYPALITLAIRGVAHDEAAKSLFHADGKKAMRRLADALGLKPGSFDLRSNRAHASRSGEITLHGDELWVQLSLSLLGPGHEVTYRRVRGRHDQLGERDRSAPVADLLNAERFADRLRRELRLSPPQAAPVLLFG